MQRRHLALRNLEALPGLQAAPCPISVSCLWVEQAVLGVILGATGPCPVLHLPRAALPVPQQRQHKAGSGHQPPASAPPSPTSHTPRAAGRTLECSHGQSLGCISVCVVQAVVLLNWDAPPECSMPAAAPAPAASLQHQQLTLWQLLSWAQTELASLSPSWPKRGRGI